MIGVTLILFGATERPALAARWRFGQRACYARHGAAAAADDGDEWHSGVHLIAALADDEVIAGMRVHERRTGHLLPVERALAERCPISAALAAHEPAPVVEMCGLWVAEPSPRPGLAAAITRTTLAACRLLGARSVVGCAHQYVLPFYRRFGARVDESLGSHPYPGPRYATRVVFADPVTLAGAVPAEHVGVARVSEQLQRGHALRYEHIDLSPRTVDHPPGRRWPSSLKKACAERLSGSTSSSRL